MKGWGYYIPINKGVCVVDASIAYVLRFYSI